MTQGQIQNACSEGETTEEEKERVLQEESKGEKRILFLL